MDAPDFFSHKVCIVGGKGRMGSWLARELTTAGAEVFAAGSKEVAGRPEFVGQHGILIISVPVSKVEQVMAAVGPHTPVDGVVMDICSLKQGPMASMLAHARGEVLGLHPMFGPSAESFAGQTVFVCKGRGEDWHAHMSGFLQSQSALVKEIEPKRHDQLMAQVQSLRHLWLLCLGRALDDMGFNLAEDLDISGTWFQNLVSMLSHQCQQPGELYTELAMNNPEMGAAAAALQQAANETLSWLKNGDSQGLNRLFQQVEAKFSAMQGDISLD